MSYIENKQGYFSFEQIINFYSNVYELLLHILNPKNPFNHDIILQYKFALAS